MGVGFTHVNIVVESGSILSHTSSQKDKDEHKEGGKEIKKKDG